MTATSAALKRAASQIGYHEQGVNRTKFGAYYSLDGEPWCAMFVSWSYATSKHPLPVMQAGMRSGYAAVASGIAWARAHGLFIPSWEAKPGDAICYGWDGPTSSPENMHTGLVVSSGPAGQTGHTIEGNRGDAVGRFTFTVGSDVVLGCIDLNKLLDGREKVVVTPAKPDPQPRNPSHPAHTGPPPPVPGKAKPHRLGLIMRGCVIRVRRLRHRNNPVTDPSDRACLTEARDAITYALQIKEKP